MNCPRCAGAAVAKVTAAAETEPRPQRKLLPLVAVRLHPPEGPVACRLGLAFRWCSEEPSVHPQHKSLQTASTLVAGSANSVLDTGASTSAWHVSRGLEESGWSWWKARSQRASPATTITS